jgi:hypothetical protein
MTHNAPLPGWHYLGQTKDYLWGKFLPEGDRPAPVAKVKKEREPDKAIVSAEKKDKSYRSILAQLDLSDRHLEDFSRRKLQEPEIKFLGTVARSLHYGYLIPFPNVDGLYTGAQVRCDKAEGGRYKWHYIRNDWSLNNSFNENPLGVYRGGNTWVWIIEGTGVKPIVASIRHGITAIGAAGGQHYLSPKTLADTLEKLGSPKTIVFCPDAGDIHNPHVLRRIEQNIEFLESLGLQVTIAWWNQDTKDKPDIDELPNLKDVRYISPEEFWGLTGLATKPEPEWLTAARNGWEKRRQFTPEQTLNDRYLPGLPQGDLILRSAMGTGKTHQLREIVKNYPHGVVMIGSRNSLLLQTIERINEGLSTVDQLIHIHSDRSVDPLQDPCGRVALCFDSLDRFEPQWFDGKLIILDESVGSIKHLTIGGTLRGKRRKIQTLFAEGMARSGAVLAMDGNQNNTIARYLDTLRGKPILRLENTFKPVALEVTIAVGENDRDYSAVIAKAVEAVEAGHRIAFVSDSQRLCEAVDLLLTGKGKKCFRVDAKTLADKEIKALVSQPNFGKWLASIGFDAVILSPSAESGVDISTSGYFSKGFGVYFGILDTDQQTQHLRRVREINEWFIHCPSRCIIPTDSRRSFFSGTHYREIAESIALELTAAAIAGDDISPYVESLRDNPHYRVLAELKASRDYELTYTRDCLISALTTSGHNAKTIAVESDPAAKALIKELREQIIRRDATAIYSSEPMDIETARRVKQSFSASLDDRFRAERTLLLDRLPGIDSTELWTVDLVVDLLFNDRQCLKRLENWYLLNNLELESKRKRDKITASLDEAWLPDIGNRLSRLRWFEKTGILNLELSDDRITAIHNSARSPQSQATKLGFSPGKWKPKQWLNRLFHDHLGIKSADGGYCSPESDPLYKFVANRLKKELADFSQDDRTQSYTGQGVECDRNECFDHGIDNSHSQAIQTHTGQGVECDPVVKNLQASNWVGRTAKILAGMWEGLTGIIECDPFPGLTGEWRCLMSIEGLGAKSIPLSDMGAPA